MVDALLLVAAKLLTGWLIADLLGGIVHWVEDRLLPDGLPFLDAAIVQPNRRHHARPMAFTSGGVVARNLTTWVVAGVASLGWALIFGPSWVWLSASIGAMVSSSVHFLAHVPPAPGHPLRVLQQIGLIQSVAEHARHHRSAEGRSYCVLTDWLNPALDAANIWTRVERLLGLPTAKPR